MSLIVLIENNQSTSEVVAEVLRKAGFNVICASTGIEAISICHQHKVDLVLTEYGGDNTTGLELVKKLTQALPQLVVVVCSERSREEAVTTQNWLVKTENYLLELPGYIQGLLDCAAMKQDLKKNKYQYRQQAQNELAQWLTHNFKNILSGSIGYLNLIDFKNENQTQEQRVEYLNESLKSQDYAINLLEQLIRLTDPEPGEAECLVVAEVADKAWETVQSKVLLNISQQSPERLAATQDTLERLVFLNSARIMGPVHMVLADLSYILESLLQNALEAVLEESTPRVLVRGEMRADCLEITVRDNGRGMVGSISQRALEPFFSTKGAVGVGLSLSLLNSIVMRQGGEVSLKSSPGVGTTFKVSLPQPGAGCPAHPGVS